MLMLIGGLLLLLVQMTILGGITAGIVALINFFAGTDFSFVLPIAIVCGLYLLLVIAQTIIALGTKRKIKDFERKHFGGKF